MKRGLLLPLLGLSLISFVSAYSNSFPGNLFDMIEPSSFYLAILFFACLIIINFSLSKVFRGKDGGSNKAIAGSLATLFSLGITYGVYQSGWDYGEMFSNIFSGVGISTSVLYPILALVVMALAVFFLFKFGLGVAFLAIGGLLSIFSLIGAFYEKSWVLFIGIVLIAIGAFLLYRRTRKTYYVGRGF